MADTAFRLIVLQRRYLLLADYTHLLLRLSLLLDVQHHAYLPG